MTSQEKRDPYRAKWENENTTDEERFTILQAMQDRAKDEDYDVSCKICKELVIFLPYREAIGEGHIYSQPGVQEYNITQICEYCFDDITTGPEEDILPRIEDSEGEPPF